MGFAEQIAARAAETKKQSCKPNRSHQDGNIGPITTSSRPEKINNRCRDSNDYIDGGSSTSSFAEQLKQRTAIVRRHEDPFGSPKHNTSSSFESTTSRKKSDHAKYLNSPIVVVAGDQQHDAKRRSIIESSSSLFQQSAPLTSPPLLSISNNNEDPSWVLSQSTRKEADDAEEEEEEEEDGTTRPMRLVQTHHHQQRTHINRCKIASSSDFSNGKTEEIEDDGNDLENPSVGLSLMDASTVSTVSDIFPQQKQSKTEPQHQLIDSSKISSSKWGQPSNDSAKKYFAERKYQGGDDETSATNDNPANSIFGAWAQIEQLKLRVHDAEERALQERQRADNVTFELRLAKQGHHHHHHQGNGSWSMSSVDGDCFDGITSALQSAESDSILDDSMKGMREGGDAPSENMQSSLQREKRELESGECVGKKLEPLEPSLALTATALSPTTATSLKSKNPNCYNPCTVSSAASTETTPPTTALLATSSHLEETDMILRLKNAEIDVLRSQVRRFEQRIQEGRDRNIIEDLTMTRSFCYGPSQLHFEDALPLGVASECMIANSSSFASKTYTTQMEELRLLRDEVRTLQYQLLRVKDGNSKGAAGGRATTTSTGGSTLSSLDENDNNFCENDAIDEVVEEEEGGNASSSSPWGLCCFRGRRRRGYGRV